ncbi:hypothetical protein BDV38DRAFT_216840 [Aspergillus pseudotamarii]|uniref:Uncharacterized protein n=1 Tax=Aspergillus pseudotamarii TaxID=132259 RepID=A0A5N6SBR0_ASPPS|nr:uncharacterized protein BDV38DRAFT_216840 [Aspergillus pseudotamarii]KAE8132146.1 hypothetical protein BDV38DRAFT_216840 [Aspergillus pseudotamarii]
MDKLARFLRTAHWQQTGQNTYFCDDPRLNALWVDLIEDLPASLRGYGLQAWKLNGTMKILEPEGPIPFQKETIITGSLHFIIALPPTRRK